MKAPELLAPAGTQRHLEMALAYGADAVYAGPPRYSLRVRNNSFRDEAALAEGIRTAHEQGARFYLVINIAPHNDKIRSALRDIEPLVALRPDALIMSDPGLIMLVRERWPELPIHLSVQANAVNWATVEFWRRQGISRIILSRELSLGEIKVIREQVAGVELEALSNRGYTEGFFRRHPPAEYQHYEEGTSLRGTREWVGEVVGADADWLDVDVKNRFRLGDFLELMSPGGNIRFRLTRLETCDGDVTEVAPGSGYRVRVPRPPGVAEVAHALLTVDLSAR